MGKLKLIKGQSGKHIKPTDEPLNKLNFDYPIFCLRHMNKYFHLDQCTDDEKVKFIDRLQKLSSMTWQQIQLAPRHGLGTEKISRDAIKAGIPTHITPDISFYALRFDGKKPFVGYKSQFIFHIVYIDRAFSLYNH